MKKWFENLSTREKWMVSSAGIIVLIFLIYFLLWMPMNSALGKLSGDIQYNNSLITWMDQVGQEIQALPQNITQKQNLSLASIQSALRASGVDNRAVSLTQSNENTFSLTINNAQFDKLIGAIIQLEQQSKMSIQALSLKQGDSGYVTGSMVLAR